MNTIKTIEKVEKNQHKFNKIAGTIGLSLLLTLNSPVAQAEEDEPITIETGFNQYSISPFEGADWEEKYEKALQYNTEEELNYFLGFFNIEKTEFSAKVREVQSTCDLKIDGILGPKTRKALEKYYYFIESEEAKIFMSYFNVGKDEFPAKLKEIQEIQGVKVDGILGPQTIKALYLNYYFADVENISYKDVRATIREHHEQNIDSKKRESVSGEQLLALRRIIYKEMHRKHYEVDTFKKEVLWGFGDINYSAPVYPFINPEIKGVPETLDEVKEKYGDLVKRIKGNDGIIVGQDTDGKFIMTYYRDGKRFLTTYVSPGSEGRETPVSSLHAVRRHDKYHRSKKYENAAMSYGVWLSGGVFFHYGVTTGYGKSHGCIRMPMMYAKIMHEETLDRKMMPFVFQPEIKFQNGEVRENYVNLQEESPNKPNT